MKTKRKAALLMVLVLLTTLIPSGLVAFADVAAASATHQVTFGTGITAVASPGAVDVTSIASGDTVTHGTEVEFTVTLAPIAGYRPVWTVNDVAQASMLRTFTLTVENDVNVALTQVPQRVAFIGARAFAYIINGNPDVGVTWNELTNTATIQGQDINGNPVTVVLTMGSNIAQINGVPTDIATFDGTAPSGSIVITPTPDGRVFLPLRFLTNAFGLAIAYEGEVVTIHSGTTEHRLWAGMGPIAGVDDPFRWLSLDDMANPFVPVVTSVQISRPQPTVGPGDTQSVNVWALDQNGNNISVAQRGFTVIATSSVAGDRIDTDHLGNSTLVVAASDTPRIITIRATHIASGVYTTALVTVRSDWPTVSVVQQVGTLRANMPGSVTVHLQTTGLPVGAYTANIWNTGLTISDWTLDDGWWTGAVNVDANGRASITINSDATTNAGSFYPRLWLQGQLPSGEPFGIHADFTIEVLQSPQQIRFLPSNAITRAPDSGLLTIEAEIWGSWSILPDETVVWSSVDLGETNVTEVSRSGNEIRLNVGANAVDGVITVTAASTTRPTLTATATITIDTGFTPEPSWAAITNITPIQRFFLLPGESVAIEAEIRDQNNESMPNERIGWSLVAFDASGSVIEPNVDSLAINGNTATLTVGSSTMFRDLSVRAGLYGEEKFNLDWVDFIVNVDVPMARAGNQSGTLTAGAAGRVTFPINTHNVSAGTYQVQIERLPAGVSVYGFELISGLTNAYSGLITINSDSSAILTLVGNTATIASVSDIPFWIFYDTDSTGWFTITDSLRLTISPSPDKPTPPTPGTDGGDNWNGGGYWGDSSNNNWDWSTPSTPTTRRDPVPPTTISTNGIDIEIRQNGDRATLSIPQTSLTQLIASATNTIHFDLSGQSTVSTVIISSSAISRFATADLGVEIVLPHATITLDSAAIASIAEQSRGTNVQFTVQPITMAQVPMSARSQIPANSELHRIAITSGGVNISNIDGEVATSVRFNGAPPAVAWRLAGNQLQLLPSEFDTQTNTITFVTNLLSIFVIGSDPNFSQAPTQAAPAPSAGFTAVPATQWTGEAMRLTVGSVVFTTGGGNPQQSDAAPFIDPATGRTMVPLRVIADGLGADVRWDDATRTAFLARGGVEVSVTIDTPLPNDMGTAVIVNNRTFVPARYVSEVLGAEVRWDEAALAVYIYN